MSYGSFSLTFPIFPDFSLTTFQFPDFSRFSRRVATLETAVMHLSDVILMTDDTDVYANAWTCVTGRPAWRLLCTWHVDRAWRRNLSRVKGDRSTQDTVCKTLRSLMELTDPDVFDMKLQQFVCSPNDDDKTRDFGSYFAREYAKRPELWAFCHRMGLRVHDNMHLEALHRVLKHVHMQGRKVRRMDKSIHALMQFMRSKMADRFLKIHKGKWTKHLHDIRSRHQTSLNLSAEAVTCLTNNMSYLVTRFWWCCVHGWAVRQHATYCRYMSTDVRGVCLASALPKPVPTNQRQLLLNYEYSWVTTYTHCTC